MKRFQEVLPGLNFSKDIPAIMAIVQTTGKLSLLPKITLGIAEEFSAVVKNS